MRKRLFEIIESAQESDRLSNVYDIFMMVVIFVSLVPLAFKRETSLFLAIDRISVVIFIIDYLLRLCTADFKVKRKKISFLLYPFTPMAILDLLCIVPSISFISNTFKIFKVFRLFRTMRVLRIFKAVRYSKSLALIHNVLKKQKRPLLTVAGFAVIYIIISALVVFNIEPDTFGNFFDAIYWATVSLTTMGYGDISPVTPFGRAVTILSSLLGIAVIALPSGIITAGFMTELNETLQENDCTLPEKTGDEIKENG